MSWALRTLGEALKISSSSTFLMLHSSANIILDNDKVKDVGKWAMSITEARVRGYKYPWSGGHHRHHGARMQRISYFKKYMVFWEWDRARMTAVVLMLRYLWEEWRWDVLLRRWSWCFIFRGNAFGKIGGWNIGGRRCYCCLEHAMALGSLNEKQTVIDSEEAKPTHCSIFSSATRTRTVPDHYHSVYLQNLVVVCAGDNLDLDASRISNHVKRTLENIRKGQLDRHARRILLLNSIDAFTLASTLPNVTDA